MHLCNCSDDRKPESVAAIGLAAGAIDPVEAIDAQAHLMSDLIHQFGSPELALAAYNAGPAPVEACHCVPAIPETSIQGRVRTSVLRVATASL